MNEIKPAPGFGQGISPARARSQAQLREDAAVAGAAPEQVRAEIAPMLKEIFYRVILGGMHAAIGQHTQAVKYLKEGARQLTLAIARAQQLAEREKLPRK